MSTIIMVPHLDNPENGVHDIIKEFGKLACSTMDNNADDCEINFIILLENDEWINFIHTHLKVILQDRYNKFILKYEELSKCEALEYQPTLWSLTISFSD